MSTETVQPPLPFSFITIKTIFGPLRMPAELVSPSIAVIPCLDVDEGGLGGGFSITHVASGHTFVAGQVCIDCAREVARRLASTSVDWDAVDPCDGAALKASIGDQYEVVIAALRLFGQCAQQMCFHSEQPCGACGGERQHAAHCIHVVGPMVARMNAAAGRRS